MNTCYRHPEREAPYYCQKDGNYMCSECACCHTPRVYCQCRTACLINMLTKEGQLRKCGKRGTAGTVESDSPQRTQRAQRKEIA